MRLFPSCDFETRIKSIKMEDSEEIEIKDEIKSESDSSSNKESDDEYFESADETTVKSGDDLLESNAAWADSVAKILKTKKPKNKRTLVLSKAKKLTDLVIREKPADIGFQIEGEVKDDKPDLSILKKLSKDAEEPVKKKRKKEIPSVRVKPNILDKDHERTLSKIATKGVVQLFNSVRLQQKEIDSKLKEAGPLIRKQENVMKKIDKRAFLNVLMQNKSQPVDEDVHKKEKKSKSENENTSTWNVLRDDFMMGAKMKDWDKEIEEESEKEVENLSESD